MKCKTRLVGFVLLACLHVAHADRPSNEILESLAQMMQGRFVTNDTGNRFVDWRQRIDAPTIGDYVFYQQLNQGPELELYRQRILVLQRNATDNRIEQRAYSLIEAERFVDADSGHPVFSAITPGDLSRNLPDGCEQIWSVTPDGFDGYVDPARCRIISGRTGKPRRIEARNRLTASGLSLVERGFDDDGKQLFGTPQGEDLQLVRGDGATSD